MITATSATVTGGTTGSDTQPAGGRSSATTSGGTRSNTSMSGVRAGSSAQAGRDATTGGTAGSNTFEGPLGGSTSPSTSDGGSAPIGGTRSAEGASTSTGGSSARQSTQAPMGGRDAGSEACDPALSARNRALVSKAIDELFVSKDITAADRYWADPYLQHNPIARSGVGTFRTLMGSLISSASFSYQRYLTLAECDLAVVYGRYSQSGVIFDMFRVRDDKIIEHWDSDSNQASEATELGTIDLTAPSAAHRQLFLDLAAVVLVGADRARVSEYLRDDYLDHRNKETAGPSALATMLTSENIVYTRVHHVIADGNFVFALSEGKRGTTNYGFYDLFRAEANQFVERWDSRRTVPSTTASGLGIF